jgi:prevent-host-death family protein
MLTAGLKTLNNKLSEYVRAAANGETVCVTDRDRVVAELIPPCEGRSPAVEDALLAEVMRRGWLRPPLVTGDAPPRGQSVAPLATVLDELAADRGR